MKWLVIAVVALAVVLIIKHLTCNCQGGGGWLGKVGLFHNPASDVQDKFVQDQAMS